MEDFKRVETIFIYNMSNIMYDYVDKQKLSLKGVMQAVKTKKLGKIEEAVDFHLQYLMGNVLLEILSLTNDTFAKGAIDFSNANIKKMLNDIKVNLPQEYKTLNGAEFLKIIRGSIAHNSQDKQNLKSNSSSYEIALPKKGVLKTATPTFSMLDLLKISTAYDTGRDLARIYGMISCDEDIESVAQMLSAHKKYGAFAKFLKCCNEAGEEVPIDKYQEAAFLRFLIKHKATINKLGNFEYFVVRYFPNKENKLNVYEHKYHLLLALDCLSGTEGNISCEDLVKIIKKEDFGGILAFLDKDFMKSLLYASLCFNMFSSITNDEIATVFKEAGVEVNQENIRHIRNSFIHGRYFYNFKDGFELYDGQKEMEHFETLNFTSIQKVFDVFCKDQIIKMKIARFEKMQENFL